MSDKQARYVVIGSGLAGYGAVRELRRLAPDAVIDVVTRDDGDFYSKPAISTALAKQKVAAALVTMPAAKMAETLRIDVHARATVTALDPTSRRVRIGETDIAYDALVLATGATPVRPTLGGDAVNDILCVNSLDDYAVFRSRLAEDASVAIIGAGLVGSEFANDLSQHGHPVTLIDPLPAPLGQLVPPRIGAALRAGLAQQGVSFRLQDSVAAIDRTGIGYRLTLKSGSAIGVDLILSATGLRPEVTLARDAGLTVDHGIVVDDHGRTSDPHIYALGDCAQYPHGISAYVTPIMTAARSIAATITGSPTAMRFPALSVQVKTSACPLVLLPPPAGTAGQWIEAGRAGGEKHLFMTDDGRVVGYAMSGDYCAERVVLDRAITSEEGLRDVA